MCLLPIQRFSKHATLRPFCPPEKSSGDLNMAAPLPEMAGNKTTGSRDVRLLPRDAEGDDEAGGGDEDVEDVRGCWGCLAGVASTGGALSR